MQPQHNTPVWGPRSLSFWLVLFVALGIIFVGIRFILDPIPASRDFGILLPEGRALFYGKIKGIRDIFSGLLFLPLLWMRMRKATAWVFTTAVIIPCTDCLIVIAANGGGDWQHWLIHGGTAFYMALTGILLLKLPKVKI